MTQKKAYFYSIGLAVLMVYTALFISFEHKKEAEAQTNGRSAFAGQIASVRLCCNGIEFYPTGQYQSTAYGSFIMYWWNMIPVPQIGLGLYSFWSILPSEKVLGDAVAGGVCNELTYYCAPITPETYTVLQMGTTLVPSI